LFPVTEQNECKRSVYHAALDSADNGRQGYSNFGAILYCFNCTLAITTHSTRRLAYESIARFESK